MEQNSLVSTQILNEKTPKWCHISRRPTWKWPKITQKCENFDLQKSSEKRKILTLCKFWTEYTHYYSNFEWNNTRILISQFWTMKNFGIFWSQKMTIFRKKNPEKYNFFTWVQVLEQKMVVSNRMLNIKMRWFSHISKN